MSSSTSRSLVDGLANGLADMSALEQQLDKEAAKAREGSLSRSFKDVGAPPSPARGRLGSGGSMMKRPNKTSAPISIQGKPAKTTVGFGSNSFTTVSGPSGSVGSGPSSLGSGNRRLPRAPSSGGKSFNDGGNGSGSFKSRSPGGHPNPKGKKGSPLPPHSPSPQASQSHLPPSSAAGGGSENNSSSDSAAATAAAAVVEAAASGAGGGSGGGKNEKEEKKKGGGPPEGFVKKPKLSKAERRAKQEKQRADKAAKKAEEDAKTAGGGASKSAAKAAKAKKADASKDGGVGGGGSGGGGGGGGGGGSGGGGGDKASKAKKSAAAGGGSTVLKSSGGGQ